MPRVTPGGKVNAAVSYYATHRDEILAKRRVHDAANREALREYLKKYRAARPELTKVRQRLSYERNREKRLAQQKEYNKTHAAIEKKKANYLRKLYGITLRQYDELVLAQGGVCAICRQPERDKRRVGLSVDHDHNSGKVRGLLCISCNSAIGLLGEDKERAIALISYLERHECQG